MSGDGNGVGAHEIARRLVEGYDPTNPSADMYADRFVIWHNYDGVAVELDREQLAAGAELEHAALGSVLQGFGYVDRRTRACDDSVVLTHVMVGTLPDGTDVRVPACHVSTIEHGRIVRTDVYLDSAQLAPLATAFASSGVELAPPPTA
jgi:hypothetical protein